MGLDGSRLDVLARVLSCFTKLVQEAFWSPHRDTMTVPLAAGATPSRTARPR